MGCAGAPPSLPVLSTPQEGDLVQLNRAWVASTSGPPPRACPRIQLPLHLCRRARPAASGLLMMQVRPVSAPCLPSISSIPGEAGAAPTKKGPSRPQYPLRLLLSPGERGDADVTTVASEPSQLLQSLLTSPPSCGCRVPVTSVILSSILGLLLGRVAPQGCVGIWTH